jgi:hypothetical protein
MSDADRVTRPKDGFDWLIGGHEDVAWISDGTSTGLAITSAIPPVFSDYATLELSRRATDEQVREHDRAVVALLERYAVSTPWWLGYLETGSSDVIFAEAPRVTPYEVDWRYVLVQAGPEQAATWRTDVWKSTVLPDLVFPEDRGWLYSTLWDDDWSCLGGPSELVNDLLSHPVLGSHARRVTIDQEDATPPGHTAI